MNKITNPVIERMSYLYEILRQLEVRQQLRVTSTELGELTGQMATTVRKDIHFIGYKGTFGTRYDVRELRSVIAGRFGFTTVKSACIIGLGALGSALLNHVIAAQEPDLHMVAAFDSNVNRLETIRTTVELYPANRIEEVIARKKIALAIIAVPVVSAQEVVDRCCDGGVSGILNFSPVRVQLKRSDVSIRSFDMSSELRILSARSFLSV